MTYVPDDMRALVAEAVEAEMYVLRLRAIGLTEEDARASLWRAREFVRLSDARFVDVLEREYQAKLREVLEA